MSAARMTSRLRRLYDKTVRRFSSNTVARWMVLWELYLARVHSHSKVHYKRLISKDQRQVVRSRAKPTTADTDWDWQDYPKLSGFMHWYEYFSTAWMLYAILRFLVLGPLQQLVAAFDESQYRLAMPLNCYFLGRFVLYESVSEQSAAFFSLFHLIFRYAKRLYDNHYFLSATYFLLMSRDDLRRFLGSMSTRQEQRPGGLEPLAANQVQEVFFRRVLCYKVGAALSGDLSYKLRPHRTPSCRRELTGRLVVGTLYLSVLLLAAVLPITVWILLVLFSDRHYLRSYRHCDPALERLVGRTPFGRWSATHNQHQVVALLVDVVDNFVIWAESGAAALFVLFFIHFLNHDLLVYWRYLHAKILILAEPSFFDCGRVFGDPKAERLDSARRRVSATDRSERMSSPPSPTCPVVELRAEAHDFFREIRRVDLIVSEILTITILLWVLTFAFYGETVITYYILNKQTAEAPVVIVLLQAMTFGMVSVHSMSMFRLHNCCTRSYRRICSLMARDMDVDHKRTLIEIGELFNARNSSHYTLFRQYQYSKTTFLSIIGWSVLCFLTLDELLRHNNY